MKNFKLGKVYASYYDPHEITSWNELRRISQDYGDILPVTFILNATFYHNQEMENEIEIKNAFKTATVCLHCNLKEVMTFFTTDIVKADIKKISLKKEKYHGRAVYKDHYEAKYILKKQQNGIESFSFQTNDKDLFREFVENVSVKALPSGKLDVPTNKKLVKLNKKAIKRVNNL